MKHAYTKIRHYKTKIENLLITIACHISLSTFIALFNNYRISLRIPEVRDLSDLDSESGFESN